MNRLFLTAFLAAGLLGFALAGPALLSAENAAGQVQPGNDPGKLGSMAANATSGSSSGMNIGMQNGTKTAAGGAQVDVGKGSNETVQYYTYTPNRIEINAGESVTWKSTAQMTEFHTVTFSDPSVVTDIILPFSTTSQQFGLVPPFNAGEPVTIDTPNGTAIAGINKLAFYPSVMDANNQTSYLNGTGVQYDMADSVKVLNSGIIQPPATSAAQGTVPSNSSMIPGPAETTGSAGVNPNALGVLNGTQTSANSTGADQQGMNGPPFPMTSSFTVKFEKPGTYDYYCAFHPWMTGQVVVKGSDMTGTAGAGLNGTTTSSSDGSNMTTFEEEALKKTP